jgi:recombination protein RecT
MTAPTAAKQPTQAGRQPGGQGGAIARDPAQTITALLQSQKKQIALALPRHMTPDRMLRIALTELRRTKALQKCDPLSFLAAIIQCSQLGLEPGNALGHAYLIPYGSECQLIIGYRGMIELARRSGQIVSIGAYPVHEADDFSYELGLEPTIKHRPATDAEPGALTYTYAVARLKDGGLQSEVMSRAQIEAIRRRSRAANNGPWVTDFDEMARKTVIRRLWKYLPTSIEMARAIDVIEREDADAPIEITNYETGEPISLEMPPATTTEVRDHIQIEAIDREWVKVRELGGDPQKIVGDRTAEQLAQEPHAKRQVALELLVAWQKQQGAKS